LTADTALAFEAKLKQAVRLGDYFNYLFHTVFIFISFLATCVSTLNLLPVSQVIKKKEQNAKVVEIWKILSV